MRRCSSCSAISRDYRRWIDSSAATCLSEDGMCELIEHLYAERGSLGEETFAAANRRVRQALRQLLDQELKVAGKSEG